MLIELDVTRGDHGRLTGTITWPGQRTATGFQGTLELLALLEQAAGPAAGADATSSQPSPR